MRYIHLENAKKESAILLCKDLKETLCKKTEQNNNPIIKSTGKTNLPYLLEKAGGNKNSLALELILNDIEIEFEQCCMTLDRHSFVYCNHLDTPVTNPIRMEKQFNSKGSMHSTIKSRLLKENLCLDSLPLMWTGSEVSKKEAFRTFVFTELFQIMHVNYISYNFAFDIAQTLHKKNTLMRIGAGTKGTEGIILYDNGMQYTAFLEGRISSEQYILLLHISEAL